MGAPARTRLAGRTLDPSSSRWGYALAGVVGLLAWATVVSTLQPADATGWFLWWYAADPALGLLSLVTASWRRQQPAWAVLVSGALTVPSVAAVGGFLLTACSVAARHRVREIALVAVVTFVTSAVSFELRVGTAESRHWWDEAVWSLLLMSALLVGGAVLGWRQKVRRANAAWHQAAGDAEAAGVAHRARTAERTRIARDMHDDLGHRFSLVAMHASALISRPDLTPEQQRSVQLTIEEHAHLALKELRDVLGLLRDHEDTCRGPDASSGGCNVLGAVPTLVSEARAVGLRVNLDNSLPARHAHVHCRTIYRVVQESLTNVRKHAPLADVAVSLTGAEGQDLVVRVENSSGGPGGGASLPSARLGLLGLRERVSLVGGQLTFGSTGHRSFMVQATLPWAS